MSSTLVAPLLISVPFGVSATNPTYINLPIPVPDQTGITVNAASFTTGFPPSTMTPEASGGLPFFGQDMNGILYMISAYCANYAAGAVSKYNSTLSTAITGYPLGAVLGNTNGDGLWINQVDGNTTNPDSGGANWLPFGGVGETSVAVAAIDITLTALQSALPFVLLTGTLGANINVIFPANAGQQWIVANATTGAHTITAKTSGGTGAAIPATGAAAPTSIYCDGTNIQNTGVSTAGLAPINSPALTGTPTAPTAATVTSTTQLATTAFTHAAITAALSGYALLASPTFSGNPTAPTQGSSDNSTKLATTAFVKTAVAGTVSLVANGYAKLPGGLVIQWGYAGPSSGGPAVVTFPIAFPNACFSITATASPVNGTINVSNPASSATQFTLQNGAAGDFTSWIAVGH